MPITLAKHSGFCIGVRKAMEKALTETASAIGQGKRVFALGDLIHNRLAVEQLHEAGVEKCDSPEQIPEGSAVILRSHGVPPKLLQACKDRNLTLIDCTCDYVAFVHKLVREAAEKGTPVILLKCRRPRAGASGTRTGNRRTGNASWFRIF